MKTKFYITLAIIFAFLGNARSQTAPTTVDYVALPSPYCSVGTQFGAQPGYFPSSIVQAGVNNTGTDICQQYGTIKTFQAMVWDNVTSITSQTNFTSEVYLSWNYGDLPTGSMMFTFPAGQTGGYDPDVAIFSDAFGTYIQVVFENNTTGKIDGYSFKWNGTAFALYNPYKSTLCRDVTKKAKNPNIATTKTIGRYAVVWHEEGLVNPPQTLTITYSTTPPQSYTNTVAILESKVYIHIVDKPNYTADLLGSTTLSSADILGSEVIRTTPPGSYHLFDRNYNPDVSYSEEIIGSGLNPGQTVASVVFLSQWFDPSTFSIVSGGLSVVQGNMYDFRWNGSNVLTTTKNFTTSYTGKPRIAARLSFTSTYTAKDFSVTMGNSTAIAPPCGGASTITSKMHNWWFQSGTGSVVCPTSGVDLILGTPYSTVTTVDPVISCVNGKGNYNITFCSNNVTANRFDIVANTYRQGALASAGAYSFVNYGTCSPTMVGNQVIPSVASFRKPGASVSQDAFSNYLFWDQNSSTLNYKKYTTTNVPGAGVALRQMQDKDQRNTKFMAYPNPTDHEILFNFQLGESEIANEIEIYNMMGQSVDKFSIAEDLTEQKRDVSKIPSGTYIAILKTNIQNHTLEFIRK